jgi:hypothetical protein
MTTRTSVRKSDSKASDSLILKDLSLALLTPDQFQAITAANYHHPESRLILQLFLHANYRMAPGSQDTEQAIFDRFH